MRWSAILLTAAAFSACAATARPPAPPEGQPQGRIDSVCDGSRGNLLYLGRDADGTLRALAAVPNGCPKADAAPPLASAAPSPKR